MARKLRVLQIGCGGRAQAHVQAMAECGEVDIVGICDLDEKKLKETADKYKIEKRYSNMEEAIKKCDAELVDIVTPPTLRLSIVEPALKAGAKAILIEKPIALTPSESRKLVKLGDERLIAVNTQYQWMPHWQKFWKLLAEKAIGDIERICCGTTTNILEQGPHCMDLALKAARISGLPDPEWVIAACTGLERFGKFPVPKDTSATIGLGQTRIHLNQGPSSRPVPKEDCPWFHNHVDILGSKGRIFVTLNQGWKMWTEKGMESGFTGWPQNDGESQRGMFLELRDRIHAGTWKDFPTSVANAGKVSDLMFACYASALDGGRIDLKKELPDSVVDRLEGLK